MEGLKLRTFIVAGIFLAFGAFLMLAPKTAVASKTEKQLEQLAPKKIGKFEFQAGSDNPEQSYKMDERTYDILIPFGIVGRLYSDGYNSYDVMLIAGARKESFHDNRVCFQGQGWTIKNQTVVELDTSRGKIPMLLLDIEHRVRGRNFALMWYKGPGGKCFAINQQLTKEMLWTQLKGSGDLESVFYRIIPQGTVTKEQLMDFTKQYIEAAKESSNGYF